MESIPALRGPRDGHPGAECERRGGFGENDLNDLNTPAIGGRESHFGAGVGDSFENFSKMDTTTKPVESRLNGS